MKPGLKAHGPGPGRANMGLGRAGPTWAWAGPGFSANPNLTTFPPKSPLLQYPHHPYHPLRPSCQAMKFLLQPNTPIQSTSQSPKIPL